MFDAFHDVEERRQAGNTLAQEVMESWANAEWFLNKPEVPAEIRVTVYKVPGETNTDDLSPAVDAWSRPDIPLHAQAMLKSRMDKPLETIEELKKKGHPLAYVGDVVGTGSSRKSATNSVLWHMGKTFHLYRINVLVESVLAEKSHRFSSTQWKMLAPYQLNATSHK